MKLSPLFINLFIFINIDLRILNPYIPEYPFPSAGHKLAKRGKTPKWGKKPIAYGAHFVCFCVGKY